MNRRGKFILGSLVAVVICLTVGGLSGMVTREAIPVWYAGLEKPFFTPPNGLFAPVWSTLYILMGIAVGGIWSKGNKHPWVKTSLFFFVAQLAVNALWSLAFFGLKSPLLALGIIFVLLALIVRTIQLFARIERFMAYLLYPYLAWVIFATFLNLGIVYLN